MPDTDERNFKAALKRGWRRKSPNCGQGSIMEGYLSVGQRCQACGQELFHHRADDGPAYLTVLIVGHVMAPLLLLCLYPLAARTFRNAL